MEEEVGIKVTRLRRRLSVEAEDVKSPSTQSTPTKKRGRLATKPQLELIDENVPATDIEKPKRTRKSMVRDAEPEERAITPSRRSTRIRSNTSVVSETPIETEDKGTPSRRNTRIKSNTSIVAETTQHIDSPRAKRAARRTSQVGSDNEAPITPGRSTRRTRKDSTSSIDKQAELNQLENKLGPQLKEVIIEETENNIKDSTSIVTHVKETNDSATTRKSPRLIGKTGKMLSPHQKNKYDPENVKESKKYNENSDSANLSVLSPKALKSNKDHEAINISDSSSTLINQLDSEPKKCNANLNKTTSTIEEAQSKSKRRRTKSWSTITLNSPNDNNCLSDTEASRKKRKSNTTSQSGSGESVLNTSDSSIRKTEDQCGFEDISLSSSKSDKHKKKRNDKSILNAETKVLAVNTLAKFDKSVSDDKDLSLETEEPNFTENFFREAPYGAIESLIYIEDSDSNTGTTKKGNVLQEIETEDQCVPIVEHQLGDQNSKEEKNNQSCEPMDIDETMPENVPLIVFTDKVTSGINDSTQQNRKSLQNVSLADNDNIDTQNKSNRKSTISELESDDTHITKSKKKSILGIEEVDDKDNSLNKSKRKSSISNFMTSDHKDTNSSSSICHNDSMNKNNTKLKRKSTIIDISFDEDETKHNSTAISKRNDTSTGMNDIHKDNDINIDKHDDQINESSSRSKINSIFDSPKKCNKSKRKSSSSNVHSNDNIDLSKKKSSLSKIHTDDSVDNDSIMESIASKNMSNTDINDNKSVINESYNNTNKRSIVADCDNKSTRKYSFTVTDNDEIDSGFNKSNYYEDNRNLISNKSKRKSSSTIYNNNLDNNCTKSNKESTLTDLLNCSIDKCSDKSKRKSGISKINIEDSAFNENCNKSTRKSSISDMESQILDKSNNANKSTLILSQIKDVSESTVPKELYELNESKDTNEQLSKSANVPNIINDQESNKQNLSLTYSTSTPLQKKPLKKLDMQVNSSIITPNRFCKIKNDSSLDKSKKKFSDLMQKDSSGTPDEDEESSEEDLEESSELYKSKLIENEADEASENYESGDSRDDDAREYEEQHEIIEKGETLDSEDENFSDDSDYEKGSFVVDSDDEDAELLSGSGDDLSMSADELSMSAKSKSKFNERKIKEQKKASREMFEARHKLDKSDNKANSNKKVSLQRLESSESDSEIKVCRQQKKNKRARIDSSQDITITQSDPDTTELKHKNEALGSLSDSVCGEIGTNELETSIHDKNETAKEDPLSLRDIVKKEPNTPQKDLNISTVFISNIEVEEVDIENNVSIIKSNQTTDPLQITLIENDPMDDESEESGSENEEITKNYESVLNNLNKKSNKVKSLEMSLNLHKKTKQKDKESIIDELNLTQTRQLKRGKQDSDQKRVEKDKPLNNKYMQKANKSINIQEEGSSDSIDMKLLFNDDSTDSEIKVSTQKENTASVEEFIPLKRTEGKTNILEKTGSAREEGENALVLNVSKSKKPKHRSSLSEETGNNEQDDANLKFFIDTTGTHTDIDKSRNTSIKSGATKNKPKINVSLTNIVNEKNDDDSPLEVSYQSEKNKSKHNLDISHTGEKNIVSPYSKTPISAKKNKKNKVKSQIIEDTDKDFNDAPLEVSYHNEKNKSKQDLDTLHNEEKTIVTPDIKTPISSKKNKNNKKNLDKSQIVVNTDEDSKDAPLEVSYQTDKKEDIPKQDLNISNTGEEKVVTPNSITPVSAKKKNKKSLDMSQITKQAEIVAQADYVQNILTGNPTKQSQKSVTGYLLSEKENDGEETKALITEDRSKKRKRTNQSNEDKTGKDDAKDLDRPDVQNESLVVINQKKKRKISHTIDNENVGGKDSTKKSKKRKERDNDVSEKLPKVIKQNSLDKVHVPRLPTNVLKQLDDFPGKCESKDKLISTTTFKVEETKKRRNKPSNYLEQSVYLNDSIEKQNKNKTVKAPKVLPFIPTASISDFGFTTNFKINVIPQETQFVAQSSDMYNFKQDYLQKNKIKKLGTFEKYKRHRTIKISKF